MLTAPKNIETEEAEKGPRFKIKLLNNFRLRFPQVKRSCKLLKPREVIFSLDFGNRYSLMSHDCNFA